MFFRKSFLIFIMLILPNVCQSETISLTSDECVRMGLANSKSLHSSRMEMMFAKAKASESRTYRLPSLSFSASYTRLSDIPPFRVNLPFQPGTSFTISPTILNNYNFKLSLQQPLFTGFRLSSSYAAAKNSSAAAESDYNADKADLIYSVRHAYWGLYKAIELKKVADENVSRMESHLKDIQNFFSKGLITKNEVLRVRVQLTNAQITQVDAMHAVRLAEISLNSVIGLPLDTQIDIDSEVNQQEAQYSELDDLVQQALKYRPELRSIESKVRAGSDGIKTARASWFPQLYLTGNYYYSRPNQRILPAEDRFKDTWDIGVMANLDIWSWGRTAYQVRQAKAKYSELNDAQGQLIDAITLEVTSDFFEYRKSKQLVDMAGENVDEAEENWKITRNEFENGLALNSDLLDAEVALLQAKTSYTQAVVDYHLADAKLKKSIGEKSSDAAR